MPISGESVEEGLRAIAEIDAKIEVITAYKLKKEAIEEKKGSIEQLKGELETQNALVAAVDPDLLDMISRSASPSNERRDGGATVDIDQDVTQAKERIAEINQAVEVAEELEM